MYLQLAENAPFLSKKHGNRHPVKAVVLAPGRALFLLLLDENIDGLASRLATEDISGLSAQWEKMGGDKQKLVKFINNGKGKKKRDFGFLKKFQGPQTLADDSSDENPAGLTADQKAKIIAASTALGAAIGATIPAAAPIAIPGGPILGTVIVGVAPYIKNAAKRTDSSEAAGAAAPTIPDPGPSTFPDGGSTAVESGWFDRTNFTGFTNKQTALASVNIVGITGSVIMFRKRKKAAAFTILGLTAVADIAYYLSTKNQ